MGGSIFHERKPAKWLTFILAFTVMNAIFGLNMNTTSIQKVENSRFARADLEGKLLMVDDDLDMNALTKTNYIKSIVTAELQMDLERKKEQSYQGLLYVRFLCFGNGALTALHDRSDGFFRRQIILTTKDKPADRFDDPFLAEKLIAEKEGIFLWMLEGLRRLIANHYHFTISQRARNNITSAVRAANNILDFLDSEGYVAFKADYEASTKNLYAAYKRWCEDNAENPLSPKSFANQLSQNAERYHLEPVNNLHIGGGKRCRGYMGAFMFCSHLWNCNETSKPSVRAFMRSGSGAACGTKERTNAKIQSSLLYLIARLGIKIGYAQSMVVQTVKNITVNRTQIIIR